MSAGPAAARRIGSDDPALTGAVGTGFEAVAHSIHPHDSFTVIVGQDPNAVVVTGTMNRFGETILLCDRPPGTNCFVTSWAGTPVTLTFSGPISAVGLTALPPSASCPAQATITGTLGSETITSTASGFAGAADIGDITSVVLSQTGGTSCLYAGWDDLLLVPGHGSGPPADLSVVARLPPSAIEDEALGTSIMLGNAGPGLATGVTVIDLLPDSLNYGGGARPDVTLDPSNHSLTWTVGDLTSGAQTSLPLGLRTPATHNTWACYSRVVNVAIARSSSADPAAANNVSVSTLAYDTSRAPPEDCFSGLDDNCNGSIDCLDPACRPLQQCHDFRILVKDTFLGFFADSRFFELPFGVPPPDGTINVPPPAPYPDWTQARPALQCFRSVLGHPEAVPQWCCDSRPTSDLASNPSQNDWDATCTPLDPNGLTAEPPVNAMGHGRATSGQTIRYTIHYENIGNVDAHGVLLLDPLPAQIDETTLAIENGGTFDAANRLLTWIDPSSSRTSRAASPSRRRCARTRLRGRACATWPRSSSPTRCRRRASIPTSSSTRCRTRAFQSSRTWRSAAAIRRAPALSGRSC